MRDVLWKIISTADENAVECSGCSKAKCGDFMHHCSGCHDANCGECAFKDGNFMHHCSGCHEAKCQDCAFKDGNCMHYCSGCYEACARIALARSSVVPVCTTPGTAGCELLNTSRTIK